MEHPLRGLKVAFQTEGKKSSDLVGFCIRGDGVDVFGGDMVRDDGGPLQGVDRFSHVSERYVGESGAGSFVDGDPFFFCDAGHFLTDRVIGEGTEPVDRTPGLDRVDDFR